MYSVRKLMFSTIDRTRDMSVLLKNVKKSRFEQGLAGHGDTPGQGRAPLA